MFRQNSNRNHFKISHLLYKKYLIFILTLIICPITKNNVTQKPLLTKSRFTKYSIEIPTKLATSAIRMILA